MKKGYTKSARNPSIHWYGRRDSNLPHSASGFPVIGFTMGCWRQRATAVHVQCGGKNGWHQYPSREIPADGTAALTRDSRLTIVPESRRIPSVSRYIVRAFEVEHTRRGETLIEAIGPLPDSQPLVRPPYSDVRAADAPGGVRVGETDSAYAERDLARVTGRAMEPAITTRIWLLPRTNQAST